MTHDFRIHQLTPDDLPLMHGRLSMFGEAFAERDTYSNHRPDDAYLRRLLASDTFIAIAAVQAASPFPHDSRLTTC